MSDVSDSLVEELRLFNHYKAAERMASLERALIKARDGFEHMREVAKLASRSFGSIVERAEKAERELTAARSERDGLRAALATEAQNANTYAHQRDAAIAKNGASNIVECGACDAPVRFGHSEEDCETIRELRVTLARLTADLAAVTSDRDMWRSECESISAELDLPPGIRPAEGELRRMLDHSRTLLAQVTTLTAERDSLRTVLTAAANEVARESAKREARLAEVERERDEARGLLAEAWTTAAFSGDLRARIAAHLGRSE